MLKVVISLFALLATTQVFAADTLSEVLMLSQLNTMKISRAIDWKVGDSASYNIDMSIIKGTMVMSVASNDGNEVVINQDADLGFAGKQQTQTYMDANTGAVKKVLVNGQEQQLPEQNIEVIEIVDETIKVPAGEFKCLHARLSDKSAGKEINLWNNSTVSMSGMVKTIQPSQFGDVTVELTSFKKQ